MDRYLPGRLHVYRWAYNKLVCEPKATKSTGARDGLYFVPMAPPGAQNMMEDVFWKRIDQGGADGLALLRTNDPAAAARINKDRLATFVMSFLFRASSTPSMSSTMTMAAGRLNR